jgi:hypothetical protein
VAEVQLANERDGLGWKITVGAAVIAAVAALAGSVVGGWFNLRGVHNTLKHEDQVELHSEQRTAYGNFLGDAYRYQADLGADTLDFRTTHQLAPLLANVDQLKHARIEALYIDVAKVIAVGSVKAEEQAGNVVTRVVRAVAEVEAFGTGEERDYGVVVQSAKDLSYAISRLQYRVRVDLGNPLK